MLTFCLTFLLMACFFSKYHIISITCSWFVKFPPKPFLLWFVRFLNLIISVISKCFECTYVIHPAWESMETFLFVLLYQLCVLVVYSIYCQFQPAEGPVWCWKASGHLHLLLFPTIGSRCRSLIFWASRLLRTRPPRLQRGRQSPHSAGRWRQRQEMQYVWECEDTRRKMEDVLSSTNPVDSSLMMKCA